MGHRHTLSITVFFVIAILWAGASAMAQTPQQVFQPPTPPPDKFDWIQLKSGEWLKGELIALYEDSLEFDSDELNDLKLDGTMCGKCGPDESSRCVSWTER